MHRTAPAEEIPYALGPPLGILTPQVCPKAWPKGPQPHPLPMSQARPGEAASL